MVVQPLSIFQIHDLLQNNFQLSFSDISNLYYISLVDVQHFVLFIQYLEVIQTQLKADGVFIYALTYCTNPPSHAKLEFYAIALLDS